MLTFFEGFLSARRSIVASEETVEIREPQPPRDRLDISCGQVVAGHPALFGVLPRRLGQPWRALRLRNRRGKRRLACALGAREHEAHGHAGAPRKRSTAHERFQLNQPMSASTRNTAYCTAVIGSPRAMNVGT